MYALGLAALGQSGIPGKSLMPMLQLLHILLLLQCDRKYNLIVVHQITEDGSLNVGNEGSSHI